MTRKNMIAPFGSPLYVAAKPAGALCNLHCRYCYYLEKRHLYSDTSYMMGDALLEQFVREYIQSQTMQQVLFTWHGGEPLMRPLPFYQKAMRLQQRYARGKQIDNCLQTNGTLLNDEWCQFFHDNGWLIGVSIDGTQEMHDRYRRSAGGAPTWQQVMHGIELLDRHEVQWNAMATVNAYNADSPSAFYHFFKDLHCHYIQFTPVVERIIDGHIADPQETGGDIAPFSVSAQQWGDFCISLFDEWVKQDVGEYFIQLFDATLANWAGVSPGVCSLSDSCGHAAAMEFNGDVYSCDHFVFPQYKLGNIRTDTLYEMLYSDRQNRFGEQKSRLLPQCCRQCPWLFACHGECPKNRILTTPAGEPGLNCLCEGYKRFFAHAAPAMNLMKAELDAGRAPANVMQLMKKTW